MVVAEVTGQVTDRYTKEKQGPILYTEYIGVLELTTAVWLVG